MLKPTQLFITIMTVVICNLSLPSEAQQRSFTFTVNSKDYYFTEDKLNTYFGATMMTLENKGITTQNDFDLWRETFDLWKAQAFQGRYSITTYANLLGDVSYQGTTTKEMMGLKDNGKPATGNPNKKSKLAVRMDDINYYMFRFIVNDGTEFKVNM